MIELVTGVLAFFSVGVFLAHAYDAYRGAMDGISAGFRNQLFLISLFKVSANFPKVSIDDRPTGGASSNERRAVYT
jgi:hypothetical protein